MTSLKRRGLTTLINSLPIGNLKYLHLKYVSFVCDWKHVFHTTWQNGFSDIKICWADVDPKYLFYSLFTYIYDVLFLHQTDDKTVNYTNKTYCKLSFHYTKLSDFKQSTISCHQNGFQVHKHEAIIITYFVLLLLLS